MIGQENLLRTFRQQIEAETFPRFSILCGPRGSGKKLIATELSSYLETETVFVEPKVDNIREMISTAYKVTMPTLYILADADTMSLAAKNAILKVTEEPPNNAYFIMTLLSTVNTLPTIRSRAQIYYTDLYSESELRTYCRQRFADTQNEPLVLSVCETPGEIDLFMSADVKAFYEFVEKVVEHIDKVSISNAFKIDQSIAFKDSLDKYDLGLFFKLFMTICLERMRNSEDIFKYAKGVEVTSRALQSLKSVSLNSQYIFDMWILDIRKEWDDGTVNA